MQDPEQSSSEPARQKQMLDWEVPDRPPRRSVFGRLLPGIATSSHPRAASQTSAPAAAAAARKETPDTSHPAPNHASTAPAASRPALLLDRLLPPHRTYLGRSRRVFLLLIAVLLFLLLILALGLGLGLGLRSHHHSSSLPLPTGASTQIYTGDLTYYAPSLGACGWTSSASDAIVAISHAVFDAAAAGAGAGLSNPNANPLCGRMIRVERDAGGSGNRIVDVKVVDRCAGCEPTDLDLAPSVFEELADQSEGRVVGSWAWL